MLPPNFGGIAEPKFEVPQSGSAIGSKVRLKIIKKARLMESGRHVNTSFKAVLNV
jgi:hypothetical protein